MISYTTKDIGDNKLLISSGNDNIEVDKYEWLQLVRMIRDKIKKADDVAEVNGTEYLENQVIVKYSIVKGPKDSPIGVKIVLNQIGARLLTCVITLDYIDHIDCFTATIVDWDGNVKFDITADIVSMKYNSVYSGMYDLALIINLLTSSNINEIIDYMENHIHDKTLQELVLKCSKYTPADNRYGINNLTVVETEYYTEFMVKDNIVLRLNYDDMENKVSSLTTLIIEMIGANVWSKNYKPENKFNG